MAENGPYSYRSILGYSFSYPLITIIQQLLALPTKGANEVQTSPVENGLSSAAILLIVTSIESMAIGVSDRKEELGNIQFKPLQKLKEIFDDQLYSKVKEAFVVRDVIAHGHLWKGNYKYDAEYTTMFFEGEPELVEAFGDKKFKAVMEPDKRTTRILGLNLFTTRINHSDVLICLDILKQVSRKFKKDKLLEVSMFEPYMRTVGSKGKAITLENLTQQLKSI